MQNPWLKIPLADYEGHMALPQVAQATLLADVFEGALRKYAPMSVAILGCAGGNGFDRIDPQVTTRVVGIDIHPAYVATARERFQQRLPGLELIVADLQQDEVSIAPVDLVFAALLFEYVETDAVLESVRRLLKPGGCLTTVVQLPHTDAPTVTPSPFINLQSLGSCLRLVSPEFLRERAAAHSLTETESVRVTSLGGKSFQGQSFVATAPEESSEVPASNGVSRSRQPLPTESQNEP
ncbi:MAG: type 11 methyltransferase [Planctomycetota bacterium]|nr:MAG: type 11 methyltransferase [Planctomycetota bacterium]